MRRSRPGFAWRSAAGALVALACTTVLPCPAPAGDGSVPVAPRLEDRWLAANRLALRISNVGHFASDLDGNAGLEFPRGSGRMLAYAGGLWLSAWSAGERRQAVAEFGSEFVPGVAPAGLSSVDTSRFVVYRAARRDTAGRAAWVARAAPLGAPLDSTGAAPAFAGDEVLWTAFTDAGPVAPMGVRYGARVTAPLGVEVQLLAWAFDRPGPLRDAVFLRWRLIARGALPLDSVFVGTFLDPLADTRSRSFTACDTARDMVVAYRREDPDPVWGASAPALGVRLLRGPAGANRLAACVAWANGADPADDVQFRRAMTGLLPWGAAMVDSSTLQPTPFYGSGDPVAGTGWQPVWPLHAHSVAAAGPFALAPGETTEVVVAVVVGEGADRLDAVAKLRANADAAAAAWASGFANLPAPEWRPPRAWPNPAAADVRCAWSVPRDGLAVRAEILDVAGRRVRALFSGRLDAGEHEAGWDRRDERGAAVRPGIYLLHVTAGGDSRTTRLVVLR